MNEQSLKARICRTVTAEQTAKAMGSGSLAVLATPALAALMEECACKAIEDRLEEGQTSVGTVLDLRHTAATPVGMGITICAEVSEIEGRRIVFKITAEDEKGAIGNCTHERFLVMAERFTEKTYKKLEG